MTHPRKRGSTVWAAATGTMLLAAVGAPGANGQAAQIPAWRLSPQRQTIGLDDIDLHRVHGAVFTASGRIVVADAGNARLVVARVAGGVERTIGRAGDGPGEFRDLHELFVAGDTMVTYDPTLNRITWYRPDGTLVRSSGVPTIGNRHSMVRAMLFSTRFVLTALASRVSSPSGLFADTVLLAHSTAGSRQTSLIGEYLWQNSYVAPQGNGTTVYATPFLGEALVAPAGAGLALVHLAGAEVQLLELDGTIAGRISIPEPRQRFDRVLVDRYRDSLLRLVRRNPTAFPGAEERIDGVFGPEFPIPEQRPVIERMRAIGPLLWLRAYRLKDRDPVTWYVVDPSRKAVAARLTLSPEWDVLGGDARRVLVLHRDEDGVETVAVHEILR